MHVEIDKVEDITRNKNYDKYQRDKIATKFYKSTQWVKVRRQVMVRDNLLCQHCLDVKKITKANMVHHIIELKRDWSKRLELNNLISLCNTCHNKIGHMKG